jgi:hypothetical protein
VFYGVYQKMIVHEILSLNILEVTVFDSYGWGKVIALEILAFKIVPSLDLSVLIWDSYSQRALDP